MVAVGFETENDFELSASFVLDGDVAICVTSKFNQLLISRTTLIMPTYESYSSYEYLEVTS